MPLNIKVTSRAAPAEDAQPSGDVVAEADGSSAQAPKQKLGIFVNKKEAAAPQVAPTKEKRSLFGTAKPASTEKSVSKGLFGNREPTADKAETGSAEPSKKEGGSLGGLFKKASPKQAAAEKPGVAKSKPLKAKKAEKAAPSKGGSKAVNILVELEDGRKVSWALTKTGLVQLEDGEISGRTLSFSARDHRYGTESALTAAAAQSLALSELGEDVRIVNASKQFRAVYATTTERTKEFGSAEVGPGLLVVEAAGSSSEEASATDRILGVQLLSQDGTLGLVVLYHLGPNGEASSPQITVNPGDLSFVLAQFVSARRLDEDTTRVALLNNTDLLEAVASFKAYPTQAQFFGLPVSKVLNGVTALSVVAAVAAGAYAGLGYTEKLAAESARVRAQSALKTAKESTTAKLDSSVVSFSRTQALELNAALDLANALWIPGTTIVLDSTTERNVYMVRMPMVRSSAVAGRPSVLDRTTEDQVQALATLPMPEGCSKSLINFSGALNAAQVTVECQGNPGPLPSYRVE